MKAPIIKTYGGPESSGSPISTAPRPGPGEMLVSVGAAASPPPPTGACAPRPFPVRSARVAGR